MYLPQIFTQMHAPRVEILNIGDEILYGQITNTNAQWMSAELDKIGMRVVRHSVISDQHEDILTGLREAADRAEVVLITGGLGPTKDDVTKKALCEYFDTPLVIQEEALAQITEFFQKRGREMLEVNKQQAAIPQKATYLPNQKGTAPGMWLEQEGKIYVSMPGVPHEMEHLMQTAVLPKLQAHFQTPFLVHRMVKTVGIGESFLAKEIEAWEDQLPPHIRLAYLPSFGMVRLRLTGEGDDRKTLQEEIAAQEKALLPLINKYVYGFDNEDLADNVGKLLVAQNKTLAIAESCTGGYLAHCFTKHAGSSAYLKGGIVAYSNEIKQTLLGVPAEILESHGAVSEETVLLMAENVRKLLGADIGIATSGIAGPGGATPTKPVGTIWVAYADATECKAKLYQLGNDRSVNIQITSNLLIDWVRRKNGYRLDSL